ncbi:MULTISPECIES: ATP-dependent DNA helicase RecG [Ralstonia solanacearum species complex]|uniref:ATP-dependent DNA helicase RecG n=9 Tax=Ralstonia solanacearum species complex TaxID=3116862 RepID=A0A0S4V5D6_RALSL|nr:ATP-dependent DNA helicase RecG [Ralstonia pseudosolanacearum]AUS41550.1 DNA helicase RecG [Ralstonia solanacearum]API73765.1 ATP-dependent DNA helicase RecG [Ralstonia pseudosolanacearum]AST28220.1 DNA helicase RecG [Ralstonia pseudosolanacearum]AST85599.1 DNA helicase RecG [Ralstonia pseudosolanacearum]AYA45659.1 DNA helicase RecG [Ralstonia pseudosolanacearum]
MPARARSATAAVPAPDADTAPAAGPRRAPAAKPADKPAAKTARPADKLAKLGLRRDVDLVLHLPMRYEDETALLTIAEAVARANTGWAAQVDGVVTRNEVAFRPRRQLVVHIADDSGELVLRFLNFYGSQVKQMAEGARLRVRGEVRGGFFGAEMVHPAVRAVTPDEPLPDRLTPVYPSTAGVAQAYLRKAILNALGRTPLPETLPDSLLRGPLAPLKLMAPAEAVRLLHQPTPDVDEHSLVERTHPAWLRIKFDELLAQQLSLKRAQAARRTRSAPVLRAGGADGLLARFLAALPFKLTGAQARVWEEIRADLARPYPMQRLLQGDVGSGKTVIAALAACQAIDAGRQAALMAPTELLAEQHYRKLSAWLAPLGVDIVWLAGSLKRKQKDEAAARVAAGTAQLVIGTHALIQDTVTFARLGLAVVDEQHRFGVAQRLALRGKAGGTDTPVAETAQLVPHQLMMSATPIPRTLAMTYYADLDVSAIDELPPGRTPVVTRLVNDARRDEVIERIHAAAREGRQVYWVCPLIEESEALQLQTAVETFETLSQSLAGLKVGLVHGRLPSADKAAVMSAFAGGELHVLVATTVIEVGVDVPNASLMVIEHAERFGLAQLHQLRGRVGRGTAESVCILLYQAPLSPTAKQRLQTMRETTDGFEIARRDLDIRGPGEFLGARQSGEAMLRFADLNHDAWMVEFAQGAAEQMLARFPDAVEAHLKRWLGEREHYLRV